MSLYMKMHPVITIIVILMFTLTGIFALFSVTTVSAQTTIFSDNFEGGNLNLWYEHTFGSLSTERAMSPTHSCNITGGMLTASFDAPFPNQAQVYFYVPSMNTPGLVTLIEGYMNGHALYQGAWVIIRDVGGIYTLQSTYYNGAWHYDDICEVTKDAWHSIYINQASSTSFSLWYDGILQGDDYHGTNYFGNSDVYYADVGNGGGTCYIDDYYWWTEHTDPVFIHWGPTITNTIPSITMVGNLTYANVTVNETSTMDYMTWPGWLSSSDNSHWVGTPTIIDIGLFNYTVKATSIIGGGDSYSNGSIYITPENTTIAITTGLKFTDEIHIDMSFSYPVAVVHLSSDIELLIFVNDTDISPTNWFVYGVMVERQSELITLTYTVMMQYPDFIPSGQIPKAYAIGLDVILVYGYPVICMNWLTYNGNLTWTSHITTFGNGVGGNIFGMLDSSGTIAFGVSYTHSDNIGLYARVINYTLSNDTWGIAGPECAIMEDSTPISFTSDYVFTQFSTYYLFYIAQIDGVYHTYVSLVTNSNMNNSSNAFVLLGNIVISIPTDGYSTLLFKHLDATLGILRSGSSMFTVFGFGAVGYFRAYTTTAITVSSNADFSSHNYYTITVWSDDGIVEVQDVFGLTGNFTGYTPSIYYYRGDMVLFSNLTTEQYSLRWLNGSFFIPNLICDFNAIPLTGHAPLDVIFTDHSNHADNWTWYFGDGTISYAQNPEHTYYISGFYNVSLTINYMGMNSTKIRTNYIQVLLPPTADELLSSNLIMGLIYLLMIFLPVILLNTLVERIGFVIGMLLILTVFGLGIPGFWMVSFIGYAGIGIVLWKGDW